MFKACAFHSLSWSTKLRAGIMLGLHLDCLKPIDPLGRTDIFALLSLPIHEDGMLLHLFRYSLISLIKVLYIFFFWHKVVQKYLMYLCFFRDYIFYISVYSCLFLVCENTIDFYNIDLVDHIFAKLVMSSSSFKNNFLEYSYR